MELKHTQIPVELLGRLPAGMTVVYRRGEEHLVMEDLRSEGGSRLMSDTVHIHGEPSVRIGIRQGDREGIVFVDAWWGSHAKLYSFIPREDDARPVEAFVPETGESLIAEAKCTEPGCDSTRQIQFLLPDGRSRITVCARLGCPGHHLDLAGLPAPISENLSHINYFGAGEDDGFQGV